MKFKLEITIKNSREDIWNIFADTKNLSKWQPSLKKIEPVSGIAGQPGAVSKLIYEENEREFSLKEEIIYIEEPHRLDSVYENDFAHNTDKNTFTKLSADETLWTFETEYKFKTPAMKIAGPLMKKNFVRRVQRNMERFKELTESI